MISACWSFFSRRATCAFNFFWFSSARGLRVGLRPRLFDKALRAPAARSRRHSTRWDEYRPSRRNSEPISPGSVARSASSTMASLYSAVNLRRWALATTSVSAGGAAGRLELAAPALRAGSLRSPTLRFGAANSIMRESPFSFKVPTMMSHLLRPLRVSNCGRGRCLSHVGTEGCRHTISGSKNSLREAQTEIQSLPQHDFVGH
jgi:hypothetical protein